MAPLLASHFSIFPEACLDAVGLGIAPQLTSLIGIEDFTAPLVLAPGVVGLAVTGTVVLPGAAAQAGIVKLAIAGAHFQDHVGVVADKFSDLEGAGAAAGKAVAIGDVAVVRQLALAVAVGANAGGFEGGDHGGPGLRNRLRLRCPESYTMGLRAASFQCGTAPGGQCGAGAQSAPSVDLA